jgi:hypothetical protein
LHDQNLARWIVQQAQISAEDFVLEIGPGLGALTVRFCGAARVCWRWKKMRGSSISCAKNFGFEMRDYAIAMRLISTREFFWRSAM